MRRAELALAGVWVFLGTVPLIVRTVDVPPAAVAFSRLSVAALGLAAVLLARPGGVSGLFRHRPARCVVAGAVLGLHWLVLFAAYRRAPVGTVILIVYLAPVGVAALAPRVLGETLRLRAGAALALGVVGVALVAGPGTGGASAGGMGLAGLAAASFAALILLSKPLAVAYGGMRLACMEMTVAAIVLAPVAATADWGVPQANWVWLAALGLAHTALAHSISLWALARVPATHVGILGYLEPVSVVIFAWAVLGERPGLVTLAGGVLILAGGTLLVTGGEEPAATVGPEVVEAVPG